MELASPYPLFANETFTTLTQGSGVAADRRRNARIILRAAYLVHDHHVMHVTI